MLSSREMIVTPNLVDPSIGRMDAVMRPCALPQEMRTGRLHKKSRLKAA
jgi:hypothetical protein